MILWNAFQFFEWLEKKLYKNKQTKKIVKIKKKGKEMN